MFDVLNLTSFHGVELVNNVLSEPGTQRFVLPQGFNRFGQRHGDALGDSDGLALYFSHVLWVF